MKTTRTTLLLTILLGALLPAACGDDTPDTTAKLAEGKFTAGSYLPGTLSGIALQKMSLLKTPDQVRNYMGALAEVYFDYELVGLAAAVYAADTTTLSTEVAQFASPVEAYGFYARTRPENADLIELGVEAYREGNSFYFTQNNCAVTISASDSTASDLTYRLAVTISADIKERGTIPGQFSLFQDKGRIRSSYRYTAVSFMDIPGLDRVFSVRHVVEGDTLTLFLAEDEDGEGFVHVRDHAGEKATNTADAVGFDESHGITFDSENYGTVTAGLAEGYLVGIAGYSENHQQFLSDWVASFRAEEKR